MACYVFLELDLTEHIVLTSSLPYGLTVCFQYKWAHQGWISPICVLRWN